MILAAYFIVAVMQGYHPNFCPYWLRYLDETLRLEKLILKADGMHKPRAAREYRKRLKELRWEIRFCGKDWIGDI